MTFSAMVWAAVILIALLVVLRRREAVADGLGDENRNVCSMVRGLLSSDSGIYELRKGKKRLVRYRSDR